MPTEIKTILGLSLLSGAFVGVVETVIAVRNMRRYEEWQRVGMLVCGIATLVFISWHALNIFAPEIVTALIPGELLETIRLKWYYIASALENVLFGVVLYTIFSQER